ncbi:MAG: hypothetical protein V9G19_24245 [Tetrasphaera sp.]
MIAVAAGALAAGGLLGDCSSGEDAADSPSGVSTTSASGNGAAAGSGAPAAPSSSTPAPTAAELPVIAARKASDGKTQLAVELNSVQSSGRLMTVTWSVRNNSSDDWDVNYFFWAGTYQHGPTDPLSSETAGVADGVYVLDQASARRYLPARDKEGNCVCTGGTARLTVGPGASTPLQAVFQAPPAEVSVVDVAIPHAGTFTAVPVTRT